MTTVAALVRDGVVHMAADSQTNIYDRPVYTANKVIRLQAGGHPALFGVAGDGATMGLLTYGWSPPEVPVGDLAPWFQQVAETITDLCMQRNIGLDDGRLGSSVLIGYQGQVWHIAHHQAIATDLGCGAIGRGEEPAMATMLALQDHTDLTPEAIVKQAVAYSARLTNGTGGPTRYDHT